MNHMPSYRVGDRVDIRLSRVGCKPSVLDRLLPHKHHLDTLIPHIQIPLRSPTENLPRLTPRARFETEEHWHDLMTRFITSEEKDMHWTVGGWAILFAHDHHRNE